MTQKIRPYNLLNKEQFYYPYYSSLKPNNKMLVAFHGKYRNIQKYVDVDIINPVLEVDNPTQFDMVKLLNAIKFD